MLTRARSICQCGTRSVCLLGFCLTPCLDEYSAEADLLALRSLQCQLVSHPCRLYKQNRRAQLFRAAVQVSNFPRGVPARGVLPTPRRDVLELQ